MYSTIHHPVYSVSTSSSVARHVCMYCFVVFNQPVFYCLVLYCIILFCNIHSPLLSGAIMSCIVLYGMEPVSPNCPHVCMHACMNVCYMCVWHPFMHACLYV